MNNDKITVTDAEVKEATPVPGTAVPPIFGTPPSGYVTPESDQGVKPKRIGLFIGIGIAVIALLCITGIGVMAIVGGNNGSGQDLPKIFPSKERTVSDYRAETMREIKTELGKPDSKLKKRIENAHIPSVTVESTEVIRCDVTTVDGSEKAGEADSNIDKVSMLIRFHWKGEILTGYTDLKIVYDVQNKRPIESKIDYTTDPIPTGEDFDAWFDIGAAIGHLLAL